MLDKIIACKPKSIFEIIPEEMFSPDLGTNYAKSGNCWEWNYAVAKAIQPKTYLEIGVRFGFSFVPTLIASEALEYAVGWDIESYGNNSVSAANIQKYYHGAAKWEILKVDSQSVQELPQRYDFILVDGCHTYECKRHDLRLTVGRCKYLLIDDYDYLVDVRRAVDDHLKDVGTDGWGKPSLIEWATYIPTFRGSILIKYL